MPQRKITPDMEVIYDRVAPLKFQARCLTCANDDGMHWQRSYRTEEQAILSLYQHHLDNHPLSYTAGLERARLLRESAERVKASEKVLMDYEAGVITIELDGLTTELFNLITGKEPPVTAFPTTTSTFELAAIDTELAELKRRRERIWAKQAKAKDQEQELNRELENLLVRRRRALIPEEPPGAGTVIQFSLELPLTGRQRGNSTNTYDYAAIKVGNGRWYRTGYNCPAQGETWTELVGFMQSAISHSYVTVLGEARSFVVPERA